MGFGLQVTGINLRVSGSCCKQLVSPDHHPAHFKGVALFHKSAILLSLNVLMVVSPYSLAAVTDPFQLSLSQRLPLLSLQEAHTLFCYFFWAVFMVTLSVSEQVMQSPEAVSVSELAISSLDESESDEAWSLVLLKLPATVLSSGSAVALFGLEGVW